MADMNMSKQRSALPDSLWVTSSVASLATRAQLGF
jgi:hypothetical protein